MQNKKDPLRELLESIHCVSNIEEAVSAVIQNLLFCPFCQEYLTGPSDLSEHIKKEHSNNLSGKTIKIDACEVEDNSETIYICPHCHFAVDNNRQYPTSSILMHIESHVRSIDPMARMSFQISNDKKLIQKYIKGKARFKLFFCSVCSEIFGDKKSLLNHLCLKHSHPDSKRIPQKTINFIKKCAMEIPLRKKTKVKYNIKDPSFNH